MLNRACWDTELPDWWMPRLLQITRSTCYYLTGQWAAKYLVASVDCGPLFAMSCQALLTPGTGKGPRNRLRSHRSEVIQITMANVHVLLVA